MYVCRQDVWIHKANTRLGNLSGLGQDTPPSWSATRPTGSLRDDGGAYATVRAGDIFLSPYDRSYRPTFVGGFPGPIDDLGVTLYLRSPIYEPLGTAWPMLVRLTIDDEVVYQNVSPNHIDLQMKTAGNLRKVDFVFNDMYAAMEGLGMDLSLSKAHAIELSVIQRFYGDGHTVIFYDATEAPTGMIFNLEPSNQGGYRKIDTTPEE